MITQLSVGQKFSRRLRALTSSAVVFCLLFSSLPVIAQTPQTPSTLKGESSSVLLVPNATVNAGEIRIKSDRDHDGMDDDAEVANGTNPDDPADADADADGDGLSNGDEVTLGSGVNTADSDGDGVSDGDEARLGFNPKDATDTPPVNATIVSIQVLPSPLELSINSLLGPQPVKLQVNGTLNTGATVDLSQAPDTTYTSLNTNVALVDGFGTAAGVAPGSTTITVQNGAFTAQTSVTVSNFSPVTVAELAIPGYANSVAAQGTYVFVAAGSTGLQIVDASSYRMPHIVGTFNTAGNANHVKIVGEVAYVADGDAGLSIIDVTNKSAPMLLGSVDTPGIAEGVVVVGTLAYVADGLTGLRIIDVSNPASPSIVGAVDTPGTARSVGVSGTLAVVADDAPSPGVRVINVQQPTAPVTVGSLSLTGQVKNVVVRDNFAYVANVTSGMRIVRLTNPSAPQIVATSAATLPRDVAVAGNFAFTAFQPTFGAGIVAVNEPTSPVFRGVIPVTDVSAGAPLSVAADAEYVYLTKTIAGGIVDNGSSGTTSLVIARYQPRYDRAGVAPVTSVINPQQGQTVIEGRNITLAASASDDVEVERVQFIVDNVVIANDRIVPYEASYFVPVSTTTTHTVKTIATDLNGVTSESAPITFTATPNPPPQVSLLSPQAGSILIQGQTVELLAQASDDGEVQGIVFTAGGVTFPADTEIPYRTTFTVPTGVSSLTISATANDDKGSTATASRTFTVTAALPTTVTGRVIDLGNQPIAGASVSVGSLSAQTLVDGTFSIAGVPISQSSVVAHATALVGGRQLVGRSLAFAPVAGGTTNVGNIVLQDASYESDIGNLVTFTGPDFNNRATAINLPFSFTFYGVTYSQVFVGTNGYLTFTAGSTASSEFPAGFANGLPRISPLFDDWAPDQTPGRGVFVNTQLPGKVVFTWQNVEHSRFRLNDEVSEEGNFQVILFSDGRIQFGYGRMETLGGLVGISPGGTPQLLVLKHSGLRGMNVGPTVAPYEQFLGLGESQFDLQYAFITYNPNFLGGYEVIFHHAPQTTVTGRLLDPNGGPAGGARVTVLNRTVVTGADGSFSLPKVPAAEGPLVVKSVWIGPTGQLFQGQSVATQPQVNEVTNLGDQTLSLRGETFETDFGQLVSHAPGGFPKTEFQLQFPFRFYGQSFYGQTVNRVYLNSNGYLTLSQECVKSGCNDQFGLTIAAVNDVIFAFANTPVIAPFFSTLDPANTGQVYVKSLPDKWVLTFVNVQQPGRPETNTFQLVLHADGTIRYAYNGIGNRHAHVGLSVGLFWGASEDPLTINWNTTPVRRMPLPYSFFETFMGDFGGQNGSNFDLDNSVMVFFPNDDGSYDVVRQQFTGAPPASKILFESSIDGDVDLFSINFDGTDRVNLTNNSSDDFDARFSPDRSRIAFDSYRDDPDAAVEEIYLMNPDGTNLVRLTNNPADDFNPIWSPDGTKILFLSNRNGDYEIFMMNADGSNQHSLTGYAGDSSPVWSPDGTKILVSSNRDGVGGLYIMTADGSGITHVPNTGTFGGNPDTFGKWSPDGTRIAFHSYRNGEADVFIVNADGSGLLNLTNNPSGDFSPLWSPDGTKMLFNSFRDGNFELYVSNVDGSGLVRLTNTPAHEFNAMWSPDGTKVVFSSSEDSDSASLFIVNADGTGLKPLVNNGSSNFVSDWKSVP